MANLTNINNKFLVQTGGNVGIGSTSPTSPLVVVGTGVGSSGTIGIQGANAHVGFKNSSGTFRSWVGHFNAAGHGSDADLNLKTGYGSVGNIRFSADGDTTAAQMFLQGSTGNVGIGTTSPNAFSNQTSLTINGTNNSRLDLKVGNAQKGAVIASANEMILDAGASPMQFYTGSTLHMLINTSGNVGINGASNFGSSNKAIQLFNGVYSGAFQIDSAGNVGLAQNAYQDGSWKYYQTNEAAILNLEDGEFKFFNAASGTADTGISFTERMRITSSGNVGIGTTAPGSKLNVNGNDNGSPEYSVTLGSTTTAGGTANNASSTPVNKTLLTGYSIPYSAQTNSRLTTCGFLEFASTPGWTGNQRTWAITSGYDIGGLDSGTGGNKMAIILGNAQNVSPQIGTNGAIGESGDGDGANSLVACYWDNSLNMRLANSSRLYTGAGGSAALPMITPGTDKNTGIWYPTSDTWAISTAGDERFRITSTGNVGIGTTSNQGKLDVHNTGAASILYVSSDQGNNSTTSILNLGGASGRSASIQGYRGASSNEHELVFKTYSSGQYERMRIDSSGNVGIGTTSPSKKLSVHGGIRVGNNGTEAGASKIYGDIQRPDALSFTKRNYTLLAGSSGATYFLARQWHDNINWGAGNINVIIWGVYYGKTQYNKSDFSCRYGYSSSDNDVIANFNPGSMAVPYWTSATTVSGNIEYRDLKIDIPGYQRYSFEIINPGAMNQTYDINNTSQNTCYFYPH